MKLALKIILAAATLHLLGQQISAKPWRGIVPLHSTRTDVIQLLGEPYWVVAGAITYKLPNEQVTFFFLGPTNANACGKRYSGETVLRVQVYPTKPLQLTELGLETKRIKKFDASLPPSVEFEGYVDELDGVVVRTYRGNVDLVLFVPKQEDWEFCPASQEQLEGSVMTNTCSCPTMSVESPEVVTSGDKATFDVKVGATISPITYRWTISAGKLIAGQGTSRIVVDTSGWAGTSIRGSVEIGPLDPSCGLSASSETKVVKP